jgi:hypothetical protein
MPANTSVRGVEVRHVNQATTYAHGLSRLHQTDSNQCWTLPGDVCTNDPPQPGGTDLIVDANVLFTVTRNHVLSVV